MSDRVTHGPSLSLQFLDTRPTCPWSRVCCSKPVCARPAHAGSAGRGLDSPIASMGPSLAPGSCHLCFPCLGLLGHQWRPCPEGPEAVKVAPLHSEKAALWAAPGTSRVCSSACRLPWLLPGQESGTQTAPTGMPWLTLPLVADGAAHLLGSRSDGRVPAPRPAVLPVGLHHRLLVTWLRSWFTCFSCLFPLFTGLEFIHQLCSFEVILKGLPWIVNIHRALLQPEGPRLWEALARGCAESFFFTPLSAASERQSRSRGCLLLCGQSVRSCCCCRNKLPQMQGLQTTVLEARNQKGSHWVKTEVCSGPGPPQGSKHDRQPCLFQSLEAPGAHSTPSVPAPCLFSGPWWWHGATQTIRTMPPPQDLSLTTPTKALLSCRLASSWGLGIRRGTSLGRCPASLPDAHRMICSSRQRWQCRALQTGRPSNKGVQTAGASRGKKKTKA